MRNQFWLIQRGTFNNTKGSTILGPQEDRIVDFDYMGSAEFEYGALPRAMYRIFSNIETYHFHTLDITNVRGVPFNLLCEDTKAEAIIQELKRYLENPYQLKEGFRIHAHLSDRNEDLDKYSRKINFWWCIDRYTPVGDWMLFLGAQDRVNAFLRAYNNDYQKFWKPLSTDQQTDLLNS